MQRLIGTAAMSVVVAILVWQSTEADPWCPPVINALLLAVVSGLLGLRIGTDAAWTYVRQLQQNNKVLAEQHREMQDLNAAMLKETRAEGEASGSAVRDAGSDPDTLAVRLGTDEGDQP